MYCTIWYIGQAMVSYCYLLPALVDPRSRPYRSPAMEGHGLVRPQAVLALPHMATSRARCSQVPTVLGLGVLNCRCVPANAPRGRTIKGRRLRTAVVGRLLEGASAR